ncbi:MULTISPECIES: pantoate--beta-alanine ligase [Clostridium]|jgi:pantothenate synthetase (EC 6.3.2.1)|uniref:Pantothenate synthetase n=4 Tax=Clostridium TaxID=1485 RepID=A0AAV3W827_9CLOT|nr:MULTISPECIES: pantoate--beta-alanine ligase [Clostridium]ABR34765.1 pantoate--beta-alanine ligase [Clostridium beijerinckii NCIMB 8052]AIU00341.1 pantoate--beta-alanine ligase [Clostridium beijerinckii ATCC 35702]ALB46148.1 pantoate--beta-alanine ligase [Clostridium beijerinckii NRRL B-598]AVK46742.1 pantoate--beta-alanine ligase [Clostridium sp. MF28]MBF7810605.1 pantoate--beta-alanine ligase [Clostridium beijerinckii]
MLVKEIKELRSLIKAWKREGLSVGYVPTMGALHEGHESLIKRAVEENDKVVVSVFVNPTQFGPNEDFDSYPRNINKDLELCINAGAAIVFNPEPSEMYYGDKSTSVSVSGLTSVLCGAKRPGHFDGVCLVVSKFLNIVTPDKAYFGEKDAQQVAVIKRMVRDLNIDVEIVACPIIREEDGLAKSSRNTYLSKDERKAALVLSRSLEIAKDALRKGERNANNIKNSIKEVLNSEPLAKIDYVEIVDSDSLKSVEIIERNVLIPIAVYIGKTRLIDNFTFEI